MQSITRDAPATPPRPTVLSEAEVTAAFRQGPHRFVDVGHSRLAAWRFGQGPDLVFVHGWPLTASTFRRIVARLAPRFTCHLFDLPGAGHTETGPAAPVSLPGHVETVRAALASLGLTRYAFVAHDSGGFIARMVAADDPRVRGLVLGNTEIPGHTPPLLVVYALLGRMPGGPALLRALLGRRGFRRSGLGLGGCFGDPRHLDGEFHELFIEPILGSRQVADGQMGLLRNTRSAHLGGLRQAHGRIQAPVALLWGTRDPWFPLARAREMLGSFGGAAVLREIEGAKLFPHEDRADEFAGLAGPFLESCFA